MRKLAVVAVAAVALGAPTTATGAPSVCGSNNGLFGAYAHQPGAARDLVKAAKESGVNYGEINSSFRAGGGCTL